MKLGNLFIFYAERTVTQILPNQFSFDPLVNVFQSSSLAISTTDDLFHIGKIQHVFYTAYVSSLGFV